jgi:hypothetical protein
LNISLALAIYLAKLLHVISDPAAHKARLAEIKAATDEHNKAFAAAPVLQAAVNRAKTKLDKQLAQFEAQQVAAKREQEFGLTEFQKQKREAKNMLSAAADERVKLYKMRADIERLRPQGAHDETQRKHATPP